jgi:hypothetical protein
MLSAPSSSHNQQTLSLEPLEMPEEPPTHPRQMILGADSSSQLPTRERKQKISPSLSSLSIGMTNWIEGGFQKCLPLPDLILQAD